MTDPQAREAFAAAEAAEAAWAAWYQRQAIGGASFREAFEAGWAAALEWVAPAMSRHLQWFTKDGVKICGGCLRDWPCPDAGLLREQP